MQGYYLAHPQEQLRLGDAEVAQMVGRQRQSAVWSALARLNREVMGLAHLQGDRGAADVAVTYTYTPRSRTG